MTSRTNTRTGITRYQQVYTVLSQALAAGSIAAGEALPSEPTLVRQYRVSRTTVRRALARLAAEGCIVRRRGSGTFAKDGLVKSSATRRVTHILDDLRRLGSNTRSKLLAVARVLTPELLLREWPEFGRNAVMIRRLRTVGDVPVVLETIYVPEAQAPALTARRAGPDAVLLALDRLGQQAVAANQQTTAVAADPFAAEHLRCPVGAALLNVRQLTRDANGGVLAFTSYVYRPDCYELHIQIDRARRSVPIRTNGQAAADKAAPSARVSSFGAVSATGSSQAARRHLRAAAL